MSKAHLTAIKRNKLSTPTTYLSSHGKLSGRVLDYGCGKGDDVRLLGDYLGFWNDHTFTSIEGYDPHHRPTLPAGQFDTIMCNFVGNVIEDEDERAFMVLRIMSLLKEGGVAYISVRNDKRSLKGLTSKGTWQGYVEFPFPIEKKTAGYVMYRVTNK